MYEHLGHKESVILIFEMLIIFFSVVNIKHGQLFIDNISVFTLTSWVSFLMFTVYPGGHLYSLESPHATHFLIQSAVLEFCLNFVNFSQVYSEITHSVSFGVHAVAFILCQCESSFFYNTKYVHFWWKQGVWFFFLIKSLTVFLALL